ITDYTSFKNQIPVRTYEELEPYIAKARKGEKDVLWPGEVKWFAKSSGTTNSKSKFIPITKESLYDCHFKAGKDMLSLYENNFPKTNIYKGKGLMLGGALAKSEDGEFKDGDLSAILLDEFPFWVNYHRVPDIETALIKEWDEKLDKIAKQAVNENITNLTGVPSWMLILLKRILQLSGKNNIAEVWPNLELYMHGGVNFEPYKKQFEELIPSKKMNYLEGYNASEGFIGIQDKSPSEGILLMLDYGIFYEFISMDQYRKGGKDAIDLSEVELNKSYALVITTNGGLWRYLIGDVIQFTSIFPFRIKIVGRTKSCINTFGEELMVHNTDTAISKSCKKYNCSITDYSVAPIFIDDESGGHQWFVEFAKKPLELELFIKEIDYQLKQLNSDYEAKRSNDLILKFPELIVIENNEFYLWLKENERLGGQNKIPRLTENRDIAERIISIKRSFQQKPLLIPNN
ncbi:MAG: GH3 auxin-responsive promoter family protein, partial [Bacteroidetes bacterium]|nr:GH3 auxin-responsive promoter family protein [Bacteroidota bacterium]